MNAHALLSAQGWRGHGHSLHKTDDSIGLAKPLLLNRKPNTKGLGTTQHFTSDQWWMNAFDEQLKGLETNNKGEIIKTAQSGKLNAIAKGPALGKYSLYNTFVSGGFLQGTSDLLQPSQTTSIATSDTDSSPSGNNSSEAKSESKIKGMKETKEERRARKDAKRRRKEQARALKDAARAEYKAAKKMAKKAARKAIEEPRDSESRAKTKEAKRLRREEKERKRRRRESKEKSK